MSSLFTVTVKTTCVFHFFGGVCHSLEFSSPEFNNDKLKQEMIFIICLLLIVRMKVMSLWLSTCYVSH